MLPSTGRRRRLISSAVWVRTWPKTYGKPCPARNFQPRGLNRSFAHHATVSGDGDISPSMSRARAGRVLPVPILGAQALCPSHYRRGRTFGGTAVRCGSPERPAGKHRPFLTSSWRSASSTATTSFLNTAHATLALAIRQAEIIGLHLEPPASMPCAERELRHPGSTGAVLSVHQPRGTGRVCNRAAGPVFRRYRLGLIRYPRV